MKKLLLMLLLQCGVMNGAEKGTVEFYEYPKRDLKTIMTDQIYCENRGESYSGYVFEKCKKESSHRYLALAYEEGSGSTIIGGITQIFTQQEAKKHFHELYQAWKNQ